MASRLILLLSGFAILSLTVLLFFAPPDGQERMPSLLFVGRLHPLAVHLPIALLLVLPFLELAGSMDRWAYLRPAAGVILAMGAGGVLVAASLGWMLAWSGGYSGSLVLAHFQAGDSLAMASVLLVVLREYKGVTIPYAIGLAGTFLIMGWTSHLGGSLTHGEDYLTKYMPAQLRLWLALPPAPEVAEERKTFYSARVVPILENNCVTCHDATKHKAELRLDSYALMMKGGEHGAVIRPGNPKQSELYKRISLPKEDKHFMPSDGKKPLEAHEVKFIELWIAGGASATRSLSSFAGAAGLLPVSEMGALVADYHPCLAQITAFNRTSGVSLLPRSQIPTDGLVLRTGSAPRRCDNAMLRRLARIAELIVEAELARTAVTDDGLKSIAAWPNLRTLDLSYTDVGPAGLAALTAHRHLVSINLTGTRVDETSLARLRRLHSLKHVYAFDLKSAKSARSNPNP